MTNQTTPQDGQDSSKSRQEQHPCPLCSSKGLKIIHLGLPMFLCSKDECGAVWGFWCYAIAFYFDGVFFVYEGSYWPALWEWLTDE